MFDRGDAPPRRSERADPRLIVVSNRLPVVLQRHDERWRVTAGSGGLVTALSPVLQRQRGGTWIGWSGAAAEHSAGLDGERGLLSSVRDELGYDLCTVPLGEDEIAGYYAGFSNRLLWPLFHGLWNECDFEADFFARYTEVNDRFAARVAERAEPGDFVWVQDYQLMLVGEALRRRGDVDLRLGYFLHIPFPGPEAFAKLPWRERLLSALLAFDLVAFQTEPDRRNFLECVRLFLPDARVLEQHPEYRGNVILMQIVVPSREGVPQYKDLKREIERMVGEINGRFSAPGWVPIHYRYGSVTRKELLALYRTARVALVTPLKDGMNLVSKEYCAAKNDEDGVLVLSEFAGSAAELGDDAVLVNPFDRQALALSMHLALSLPAERRKARMKRLRRVVKGYDVHAWAGDFLRLGRALPVRCRPSLPALTPTLAAPGQR